MCQSHSDLISWLSLKIAGLHLDAAKAFSSRPIPISAVGITSRTARVSPDQLNCPASLCLWPLRSTVSHQF